MNQQTIKETSRLLGLPPLYYQVLGKVRSFGVKKK